MPKAKSLASKGLHVRFEIVYHSFLFTAQHKMRGINFPLCGEFHKHCRIIEPCGRSNFSRVEFQLQAEH